MKQGIENTNHQDTRMHTRVQWTISLPNALCTRVCLCVRLSCFCQKGRQTREKLLTHTQQTHLRERHPQRALVPVRQLRQFLCCIRLARSRRAQQAQLTHTNTHTHLRERHPQCTLVPVRQLCQFLCRIRLVRSRRTHRPNEGCECEHGLICQKGFCNALVRLCGFFVQVGGVETWV